MPEEPLELNAGVVSLADQIRCVTREIKMREHCYPRWVSQGRMKVAEAQRELERMRAVLHTLQELAGR